MILHHLEALGLTFSTLTLVSVMLSTQKNRLYLVLLTAFTVAVLFTAIVAWFCVLNPAIMPAQILHISHTATWWVLPFLAGVVAYHNYEMAGQAEQAVMKKRFVAVTVLGLLLTIGLELFV